MMFALDRDNTCMLSLIAAAFYHIQSRDFKKAIDVYRAILTCLVSCFLLSSTS